MAKLISMKQDGPNVKLFLSVYEVRGLDTESEQFNIHNFAVVKFKTFTLSHITRTNREKYTHIAMKKHELAKDVSVQMTVTCIQSKQFHTYNQNLPEQWCSWVDMGRMTQDFLEVVVQVMLTKPNNVKFYEDDTLTDFQLTGDDGSVAVHKAWLAAASDMFKAKLNGKWKEKGQVQLRDVPRQTLQHFKDYIYLGKLPDDGLCPLLMFAKRYLHGILEAECMMKLVETIEAETYHSLLDFTEENQLFDLAHSIVQKTPDNIVAFKIKMQGELNVKVEA